MLSNIDKIQQAAVVEIRASVVRAGPPRLVPYAERYNHTGFTSMYGYTQAAAEYIRQSSGTRGMKEFPIYSDTLFVDFDNEEEAADDFRGLVESLGHSFEMYHSGGRSIHFHIPIEPMFGQGVPDSQKYWMEQAAPAADMSIYRHAGLYRLPGTYHAKYPGQKKHLLYSSDGSILRIENRPQGQVVFEEEGPKDEAYFHDILGKLLHMRASEGDRHKHAYKITMACRTSGKDEHYTRRLLGMWNRERCLPPKPDWELEKLINWVY